MAYTIKIHDNPNAADIVRQKIIDAIANDGRFKCQIGPVSFFYKGSREGSRKQGYGFILTKVRLTKTKPYCGQHPGPCLVNPHIGPTKKINSTWLEWDDWVSLHNLINDVLDKDNIDADMWSKPRETKGTMWMRKGTLRRTKYDYTDDFNHTWSKATGLPVRVWNLGTTDQFV